MEVTGTEREMIGYIKGQSLSSGIAGLAPAGVLSGQCDRGADTTASFGIITRCDYGGHRLTGTLTMNPFAHSAGYRALWGSWLYCSFLFNKYEPDGAMSRA